MILETKRLLLREMIPDDFQALLRVLGDPETMWHYSYTFDGQHVRKTHVSVTTREEWLNELTENMISWAEDKLGSREYAGWCLSFIEDSLEKSNVIEIFGGDTAKESALLYADAMRKGIPERGTFVFYDCICLGPDGPVNWGHCGISLGDGRIIHAWDMVRIDDYREIEAMTALSGDHPGYIGWVPIESVLYGNEISIQEIGQ